MSKKKTLILLVSLILIILALFLLSGKYTDQAKALAPPPAVPVRVTKVSSGTLPVNLRAAARLRARKSVEIKPRVDGYLEAVTVQEGSLVKVGDLLVLIDDRAILAEQEEAWARLAMTAAQLEAAERDLERYRQLKAKEAVPEQTLDQYVAKVKELQAALRVNQAALQAAAVRLSYTRIFSPIDGRVGIQNVDEGNYVRAVDNISLFSIVSVDPIDVEIAFPQSVLPSLVTARRKAGISVRLYSADGGEILAEGGLNLIDNRVATESGTIMVKAAVDNSEGRLWPGQSVRAVVHIGDLEDALLLPASSIRKGGDGDYVWRLGPNGAAETVPVEVIHIEGGRAAVAGLAPDDLVVIDGASRLAPGVSARMLNEPGEM